MPGDRSDMDHVPVQKHGIYYATAYTHFEEAKRGSDKIKQLKRKLRNTDEEYKENWHVEIAIHEAKEERLSLVVVIFCALALEAFVNDYGIKALGGAFFDEYMDRLSPIKKFALFPLLKTGGKLRTDTKGFGLTKRLFKLRNMTAHYKNPKRISETAGKASTVSLRNAKDAIEAVRTIVEEFHDHDTDVYAKWVAEAEKMETPS